MQLRRRKGIRIWGSELGYDINLRKPGDRQPFSPRRLSYRSQSEGRKRCQSPSLECCEIFLRFSNYVSIATRSR
jgi:hypothetical protein